MAPPTPEPTSDVAPRPAAGAWLLAVMRRLPAVGVAISGAVLAVLAASGAEAWRLGLVAVSLVGSALLAVDLVRATAGDAGRRRLLSFVFAVFALQTCIIVGTGGIESPLVIIFIPSSIFIAIILGRTRPWLALTTFPVVALIALALHEVLAPDDTLTLPLLDRTSTGATHAAGVLTLAAMIAIAVVAGGVVGLAMRRRLDGAWSAVSRVQTELAESLHERNQELVGLAGAIAHELKNPLAAIQGLAILLERRAAPGTRDAAQLAVLVGEARRMGRVVEEFLNFSRPISELSYRPTALAELCEEVLAMHEGMAAQAGVALASTLTPVEVACDPRKVRQVVVNLVQNAIEASPERGAVELTLTRGGGRVVITVDDRGAGLDAALAGHAFRPGVTTKGAGSGLGLTVAQAIAEQHGGGVALADRPGGGCRATLWLPEETPAPAVAPAPR